MQPDKSSWSGWRSRFAGYHAEPDEDVWRRIERRLDVATPARPPYVRYLSVAASFLLLAIGGLYFLKVGLTPELKTVPLTTQAYVPPAVAAPAEIAMAASLITTPVEMPVEVKPATAVISISVQPDNVPSPSPDAELLTTGLPVAATDYYARGLAYYSAGQYCKSHLTLTVAKSMLCNVEILHDEIDHIMGQLNSKVNNADCLCRADRRPSAD